MTTSKDSADTQVLTAAIKALTQTLNKLVGDCTGPDGKPKAPTYRTFMEAKGALPSWCEHGFPVKKD